LRESKTASSKTRKRNLQRRSSQVPWYPENYRHFLNTIQRAHNIINCAKGSTLTTNYNCDNSKDWLLV
jgi:hypothetical protein